MAKKIIGSLKLQVKAGQANPSPPVGPALGQRGLNIMAFVKEFNAKTADLPPGTPDLWHWRGRRYTPDARWLWFLRFERQQSPRQRAIPVPRPDSL